MKTATIVISLLLATSCLLLSQDEASAGSVAWVHLDYGIQFPFADLQERFGQNFAVGGGISFLGERGLYLNIDYALLFGSQVKEDVLSNLRTIEGGIIGRDQQFAEIFLRERGNQASIQAGYYFGDKSLSKKSGFILCGGIGWLQHKVRIIDEFDAVNQVIPPYERGYDRLSSGISLFQSIKYLYLSENKLVNFLAQIDISQAFTKDRRGINYNSGLSAKSNRIDILASVKLSWIIPIYLRRQNRYY